MHQATLDAVIANGDLEGAERMRAKIAEDELALQDVERRAANIRAGYVYVIFNIGAFGENMVKIGMSRRLEPMDRVNELGDASVPFRFDMHAPGRHLAETELSDMLKISRGTLREAMRQLEQEGLLSSGLRGRLSVRHLDAKEIRDIFSVRAALESLAARTLCELPDRRHAIRTLRTATAAMEAATHGTMEERVETDMDFHRTMCRLAGNETLLHSWESLEGSIRMSIMFAGLEKGVRNMSVDRHNDIVAAIETGDATLARNTIREHMDSAADNLVA
ncbi:FCD domain-containing protein [Arthrobacter sp. NPDC056691]|uniref:FCD domain-containing protein n=1 Tax=Arthrobacter sp. NPDC056691 TaxID=3345913 RepID=UPI00366FCF1C